MPGLANVVHMINIGGRIYSGNNISIVGNKVYIDGKLQSDGDGVQGNGERSQVQRDLADHFSGIDASGIDDLKVVCGSGKQGLEVSADSNLLEKVETRVAGGKLHISTPGGFESRQPIAVTLFMDEPLTSLELSRGVKGQVEGIDTDSLRVDLSAGATASLSGKARELEIDLSAGSSLNGLMLRADQVRADLSSGSSGIISVDHSLEVDASSGAILAYYGNPAVEKDVSSGASVRKM